MVGAVAAVVAGPGLWEGGLLRCGASAVFGLATVMLATALGCSLMTAAAIGSVVACLGADVASGLYARWLAKRAGICDPPPSGGGQA